MIKEWKNKLTDKKATETLMFDKHSMTARIDKRKLKHVAVQRVYACFLSSFWLYLHS